MDRKFWIGMAKDWGIAIGVAALVFALWTVMAPRAPTQGQAPDFTLTDLNGDEVTLSELQGQVVVLNFWATWCGPCRAEIPHLSSFQEQHQDVKVVGISLDEGMSAAAVKRIGERLGITYAMLHDPRGVASDPYRVSVLPTTYVVDASGSIQAGHVGAVSVEDLEHLVFHPEH